MTLTVTTDRVQTDVRNAISQVLRAVVQLSLASNQLAASPAGFTRTDGGSFLNDGFADGAELASSGFATPGNNGLSYIRGVTDNTLTVEQIAVSGTTALANENAAANATLALKYPSLRDLSRGFTPTVGAPWARLTMLRAPNATLRATIGVNPTRVHTGYAQVSLFYPRDRGSNAAESMADAVRQAAEANEFLQFNGRTIYLLSYNTNPAIGPTVLSPQFDGDWYHVPVRIPYYLFD